MRRQVETSNPLERNVELSVPREKVETEVGERLRRLAPKVKIHGFRPGKVPLKIVTQQYGQQIQQEFLGELLQKQFNETVKKENLRVAGLPNFEARSFGENGSDYEFSVTFEIYPEFEPENLESITVHKPVLQIGETEIQKTLEVLRKQRADYVSGDRPAQSG